MSKIIWYITTGIIQIEALMTDIPAEQKGKRHRKT
jgi:hypothetical protein